MNTQSHGALCVIVDLHDQPDGTGITHGTHSESVRECPGRNN